MMSDQVVRAPDSTPNLQVEQLAYIESYDAVVDKMYALVVYKETKTSGKWVLRIKSAVTAGAAFDPDATALKNALRKAAGQGQKYLVWGFNLQPKEGDPRLVENRILIDGDGNPTALEVHLITRNADSSAKDEQLATVPWPA
jgi:hypothetical protein